MDMDNDGQMMDDLQYVDEQYVDEQYADEQYADEQYADEQYADEQYVDEQFGGPQNYQREDYSNNNPRKFRNDYRNDRYNNAYGNYSGGYGPSGGYNYSGGYGPPGGFANSNNFRSGGNFGPQNNFGNNFGPCPPMFQEQFGNYSWGRGFGPGGPPMRKNPMDDKAIRYLLRCGVPKEQLKNLPRDLLALIEPEYCGLCAQEFDTNALSRIHYISKNHLRNQKKWLNLQSQIGFHRNREIPLKARDLYCELCDVHITSTTHSESHYSGKGHKSIVEGRRNPKNPILLQQGMEERVEQLIRREKRHFKSLQDEKNEKVSVKKEVEGKKSVSTELYCEICNTSVTCTDQMTMHMNGKRHLSKEKHHILKMMKGEVTGKDADTKQPQDQNNSEDSEQPQGQDNSEECNTKEEDAEKNYDWENGGEKWEEVSK